MRQFLEEFDQEYHRSELGIIIKMYSTIFSHQQDSS